MKTKPILKRLGACQESIDWAGDHTLQQCWDECQRGDWLIWLACEAGVDQKVLVFAWASWVLYDSEGISPTEARARIADIAREHIPFELVEKALEESK